MPVSAKLLRTSTFRMVAVYLVVFALSVGAILGYVYWTTTVLLDSQIDDTIDAEVQILGERYREHGLTGLREIIKQRASRDTGSIYMLTNFVGRRLAGNLGAMPARAIDVIGWLEFPYAVKGPEGRERRIARAYHTSFKGGYHLIVGRDVYERRQFQNIIRRALFVAIGMTVLLGLGGGLLMSRNFLRRVDSISRTSRAIMAGDLTERMPVTGTGDELDRLSASLNEMLDQIERLMTGMREISSNVAHDLRTPLNRLRARAEDALRSSSKAKYRSALTATMTEADQLLATFSALLSIAKAEAGQTGEGLHPVDVVKLVSDIIELYEPTIEERGGLLTLVAGGPVTVRADSQLLAQAISNLIDNALKYGLDEKTGKPHITLTIKADDTATVIAVADRGAGIAAKDRERVIRRFVRLEDSRAKPGNGLGLSLVSGVMKLHGGRLEFADNNPGLIAKLILPCGPATS